MVRPLSFILNFKSLAHWQVSLKSIAKKIWNKQTDKKCIVNRQKRKRVNTNVVIIIKKASKHSCSGFNLQQTTIIVISRYLLIN